MRLSCCEDNGHTAEPAGKALIGFLKMEKDADWASDRKEEDLRFDCESYHP